MVCFWHISQRPILFSSSALSPSEHYEPASRQTEAPESVRQWEKVGAGLRSGENRLDLYWAKLDGTKIHTYQGGPACCGSVSTDSGSSWWWVQSRRPSRWFLWSKPRKASALRRCGASCLFLVQAVTVWDAAQTSICLTFPPPGAFPGQESTFYIPDQDQRLLPGPGWSDTQGQCFPRPTKSKLQIKK